VTSGWGLFTKKIKARLEGVTFRRKELKFKLIISGDDLISHAHVNEATVKRDRGRRDSW
jgi:hypothetical protein